MQVSCWPIKDASGDVSASIVEIYTGQEREFMLRQGVRDRANQLFI